ncbi:MAG TPA: response regulator transcription factor [Blastocatellia bacterium]|nr:response regulator transcription factor [Blastocatellia bacterium]
MRLLLVEDEPRVARFIAKGLREHSYAVDLASDGEEAIFHSAVNDYDLIILDIMLPKKDGFEVCRELRTRGSRTPVLMLTARNDVDDRVMGLDSGADDYLSKPFEFKELLARVRALLRRGKELRSAVLQASNLTLNTANHAVSRDGKSISLTAKEYALLEFFLVKKGRLVSREEIARHVWDDNYDPFSNTIDVYVRRLRKKIDEGFDPPLIYTRRGEGYMLTDNAEDDSV